MHAGGSTAKTTSQGSAWARAPTAAVTLFREDCLDFSVPLSVSGSAHTVAVCALPLASIGQLYLSQIGKLSHDRSSIVGSSPHPGKGVGGAAPPLKMYPRV